MQKNHIKCKLTSTIRDLYSYNLWRTNILFKSLKTNIEKDKKFLKILLSDEGLFLKSIKGTLNHIVAADILYYLRLFELKEVQLSNINFSSNEISDLWNTNNFEGFMDNNIEMLWFENLNKLHLEINNKYTDSIDKLIEKDDFEFFYQDFIFQDTKGNLKTSPRHLSFIHVVNHATHHLGQITGVLSKYNIDNYPEMDLSYTFNLNLL